MLGERESGAQVLLHDLVRQVLQDGSVHGLLQVLAGVGHGRLGGVLGEESLGSASGGSGLLGEGLVGDGVEVDAGDVDLGAGGESVSLVHSSDGHSVHLVGTSHGDQARLQLLQSHNSLSSESARKQDQDTTSLDRASHLGSLRGVSSGSSSLIVGVVPIELSSSGFIFSLLLDHLHRSTQVSGLPQVKHYLLFLFYLYNNNYPFTYC